MEVIIAAWLSNPLILTGAAYLLTTFFPKDRIDSVLSGLQLWLEKWPIIGIFFKFGRTVWQMSQDKAQEAQTSREAGALNDALWAAGDLVKGTEQLKTQGKIDSQIAAATITRTLENKFGLDENTAKLVTEKAVYDLKQHQATISRN